MRVEVLMVRGCPHGAAAVARAREAVAQLGVGATVAERVIDHPDVAWAVGMHASPTVQVDGTDPFAPAGLPGSLSRQALTCLAIPFTSGAATMCSVAIGTGIPFASLDELVERGRLTARYNTTRESVKEEPT